MARPFEDFQLGQTFALKPQKVLREEVFAFAREFDPQPFHLDEEVANKSLLGGLAASGWHASSLFMRMTWDSWLKEAGTGLGSPGVDSMRWIRPVMAGDTLSGTATVVDTRPSKSRPGIGIVTFKNELTNEAGELVMEVVMPVLIARRGETA